MNICIKTLFVYIIIFINTNTIFSQTITKEAKISIITCAPGEEMYTAFGHSAIRVNDPATGTDYVFNYGTFNFNTPNFYLNFVKGELDYMLSVSTFKNFVNEYIYNQRGLKEQKLNLTYRQKLNIYEFLVENAQPENKYYRYDLFLDNCATRIKDVLKICLEDSLILGKSESGNESFRSTCEKYLTENKWGRFGMNLGLGQISDIVLTNEKSSFLPDYLYSIVKNSQIIIDGKKQPLVKNDTFIYKPRTKEQSKHFSLSPTLLFWSIFFVMILIFIYEKIKKRHLIIIDQFIFFIFGILGIVLLLLWTSTEHSGVVRNWNLLWALPTHFFISFFMKRKNKFIEIYFIMSGIITLSTLIFWFVIPQSYDIAFIPIILMLLLVIFKNINIKKNETN